MSLDLSIGNYFTEITVKTVGTCEKETVDAKNRILKTPKDPFQDYKNDLNCTWVLTAPPGKKIVLDPFQISTENCSGKCTCDYLEIKTSREKTARNSESNINPLKRKYCGDRNVPKIESEDNFLSIHFKSDSGQGRKGFKIKYHLK